MTVTTPKTIETGDLYFGAFLLERGVELTGTTKDDRGKVYFVFTATAQHDVAELRRAWSTSSGVVRAASYAAAIARLKSSIHYR